MKGSNDICLLCVGVIHLALAQFPSFIFYPTFPPACPCTWFRIIFICIICNLLIFEQNRKEINIGFDGTDLPLQNCVDGRKLSSLLSSLPPSLYKWLLNYKFQIVFYGAALQTLITILFRKGWRNKLSKHFGLSLSNLGNSYYSIWNRESLLPSK